MVFSELATDYLPYNTTGPANLQICDVEGHAEIWITQADYLNAIRGQAMYGGTFPNNFAVADCMASPFRFSIIAFQDTKVQTFVNSTVGTAYYLAFIGKIAVAGQKTFGIGVLSDSVSFLPSFDNSGIVLALTINSSMPPSIYGVISKRDIVSIAEVNVDGSMAKVKFYGFNANDLGNIPTDGRARYLAQDFNFTITNSPIDMRFIEYDNILYYAYQNYLDETFIHAIPSNQSAYKIGGSNNRLLSYNMIAMGSDNSTLLLAYIYITGNVWIALWDATNTVAVVPKDLGVLVNASTLRNEPLGFYRANDTYAELYLAADGMVRVFGLSVIGKTYQTVVVIDILQVNASTVIGDLVLNENSTLVINDGVVLTINGCATLNGTLVVVLSNGSTVQVLNNGAIDVLVLELACRDGDFNEIVIKSDYDLPGCDEWSAKPNYSPTQLTLTVSVTKCIEDNVPPGVDYTGLIIGVTIGGVALIVGIILLAFYFSPLRAKVFPYSRKN